MAAGTFRYIAGSLFLGHLAMSTAWAETAGSATSVATTAAVSRILGGLLLIIALIFVAAWFARRSGVATRASNQLPLKIIGTLSISPRDRVVVVEVDDQWLVLGVGPQGVRTLHALPARPLPADHGTVPNPAFQATLRSLLRRQKPGQANNSTSASASFTRDVGSDS